MRRKPSASPKREASPDLRPDYMKVYWPAQAGARPKRIGAKASNSQASNEIGAQEAWDTFTSRLSPVHQYQIQEWRRCSIPTWQAILAQSEAQGDQRRASCARWMLKVILEAPDAG